MNVIFRLLSFSENQRGVAIFEFESSRRVIITWHGVIGNCSTHME